MIEIFNAVQNEKIIVQNTVRAVFRYFKINESDAEVEVSFVTDDEILEENKAARGVEAVTDVLSFQNLDISLPFRKKDYKEDINPETGAVMLGEILICRTKAEEQAHEYGHGVEREISFLTCHGVLHLLGFDHIEQTDEEEMISLQTDIIGMVDSPKISYLEEDTAEATSSTLETDDDDNNDDDDEEYESDDEEYRSDDDDDDDVDLESEMFDVATKKGEKPVKDESGKPIKCGFVAILGRPNAGKSTLVNAIVGEKVSIVSWKPQTTRNSVLGIYNDSDSQIVFIDTPGLHSPNNALGKYMMHGVTAALEETQVVLYVIDGERGLKMDDKKNLERYLASGKKVVVAINKTDRTRREWVMDYMGALGELTDLSAIVPVSAIKNKNTAPLIAELKKLLPEEPTRAFDEELYTTQNMRFMAQEIIREKALRLLEDEIPYGVGVVVNKYEHRENGLLDIDADVVLENKNHKPIVLGKGGQMIKKISTYSRQDLEEITGDKIFLTLWVRVKEEWRDNPSILNDLGYSKNNSDNF